MANHKLGKKAEPHKIVEKPPTPSAFSQPVKPPEKPVEAAEEEKPVPQEFPKMLYRKETTNRTVANAEEEAEARKEGWGDKQ